MYANGLARSLSVYADASGTAQVYDGQIEKAISRCMGLTTSRTRTHLGLNKPIYQRPPAHGLLGLVAEADGGFNGSALV